MLLLQVRELVAPALQEVAERAAPAVQQVVTLVSGAMAEVTLVTEPFLQRAAGFLGLAANATAA